ncbi:hypothetical protein NW759_004059 [Fusarium solani]|nr:hypothetical protein NW759_004059 [Fusarium solani]
MAVTLYLDDFPPFSGAKPPRLLLYFRHAIISLSTFSPRAHGEPIRPLAAPDLLCALGTWTFGKGRWTIRLIFIPYAQWTSATSRLKREIQILPNAPQPKP